MNDIFKINSVTEYNNMVGQETLHPLVSDIDFSKLQPFYDPDIHTHYSKTQLNVYAIFLKDIKCGSMTYGIQNYDYEEGTLLFISPGQVFGVEGDIKNESLSGTALIFHPDLLRGTTLGKHIDDYTFFSYEVNEALHLSSRERESINECFKNINYELQHAIDNHSKTLIVSYLELFLNYCKRFYERQFITRSHVNKDILVRFENVLKDYFKTDLPIDLGLPSVRYCAEKLFISPNYLGDLLKKETGKSAQEHIQQKMIDVAKAKIFDTDKSVSEIAYELGFKHPQHFTRMFKKSVGMSPTVYRTFNEN
ncbi:helix-turn-helix domain-containing protein [Saccharicrinis sp. FJH62]|uniref:helix-turn-helix domain-containing protein n=1 Tax=Saccharicrinis sp. FJH62 TaxID=3344657 RepID=UPI0035D3F72F